MVCFVNFVQLELKDIAQGFPSQIVKLGKRGKIGIKEVKYFS